MGHSPFRGNLLKWQLSSISTLFHFKRQQAASWFLTVMNVVVGPFSVFEIPSGATASLLRSKRQVVSTIPCASIRAVTVRQLSASESFFVSSERIASSVAWQQDLSSKITREQQIPCWASLGFFPGCRGLEASLGRARQPAFQIETVVCLT